MNWKQWLLKGISESALKAFFGAIVASLAGAVVILYGWVPERALGGLQLLEVGLLLLILVVLAFLFLSQNQLSRERHEHLERERRELDIEHERREQRERALLQFYRKRVLTQTSAVGRISC
jgi:uncharacterized membrane protein